MSFIEGLLHNKVLIIGATAWLTAGVLKTLINFLVKNEFSPSRIFGSGGMPSSHTSTVIALAIAVGYQEGITSALFAVTIFFTIIVIHDAIGVRLETGKQAKVLNFMMFETDAFKDFDFEKELKEYVGHTPFQALVGAIVGAITAIIMINILY